MPAPKVTQLKYHRQSKSLSVSFADGTAADLSCEYLRVFSPSAEVRGHGLPEPILIAGKQDVAIQSIEPVGHYAVKLVFDDGHDSGLYSWEVLYDLTLNQQQNWQHYLARLQHSNLSRKADTTIIKL